MNITNLYISVKYFKRNDGMVKEYIIMVWYLKHYINHTHKTLPMSDTLRHYTNNCSTRRMFTEDMQLQCVNMSKHSTTEMTLGLIPVCAPVVLQ